MLLLLLLSALAFGYSDAMVNFSNSTIFDVYDLMQKEVHLAKCDDGCYIYAATMSNVFDAYPDNIDPYARNLFIHDNNIGQDLTSVANLANQKNELMMKVAFVVDGPANISVINRNPSDVKEVFTIVLYVVDKATVSSYSFEVYDIADVAGRVIKTRHEMVTFISAEPYTLEAEQSQESNSVSIWLTGFDNAREGNDDKCEMAHQAEGNKFPGFSIQPNTPLVTLALEKRNTIAIYPTLNFDHSRKLTTNGFITSPGWNGCRKQHTGGIQTFRSPFDQPTDSYLLTADESQEVVVTVYPNLDQAHEITIIFTPPGFIPVETTIDGTSPQTENFITNMLNISYTDLSGSQGFLLRHNLKSKWTAPESYCDCGMKDGWLDGFDPAEIWVDLIVVVDSTLAMGNNLELAKSVVPGFVGYMSTDPTAMFHSRIGVIAVTDTAEVVFNLNMTTDDTLNSIRQKNVEQMDFNVAVAAAFNMFQENFDIMRANARRIVYFLTNSSPPANVTGVQLFKQNRGIVIVDEFLKEGQTPDQGLKSLASDNYFFTDLHENYRYNLPVLCEANCYCNPSAVPFNDDDKSNRTSANRGCYHPVNKELTRKHASSECVQMGYAEAGALVSIHDDEKEFFINSEVSKFGPKLKYWIGLQSDGFGWNWDDQVSSNFNDWAPNQPNTQGGTKNCAYAAQSNGYNVKWTAADCEMAGVIYVCEVPPCAAGYKTCV